MENSRIIIYRISVRVNNNIIKKNKIRLTKKICIQFFKIYTPSIRLYNFLFHNIRLIKRDAIVILNTTGILLFSVPVKTSREILFDKIDLLKKNIVICYIGIYQYLPQFRWRITIQIQS